MYNDTLKKLLHATNDYFPEAEGKAYSENSYYSEPLARIRETGNPGLEYSLDSAHGHHTDIWYFSSAGSDNDPVLAQWFRPEGFIYPYKFDEPYWADSVTTLIQNVYDHTPDSIQYSLTVMKDPDGNYRQILTDKFDRTVRTWADSDKDKYNGKGEIIAEYEYDILGNVLENIPPKDRDSTVNPKKLLDNTSLVYDSYGRVIKETTPDKGVTTYEYDDAGNLVTVTKAAGVEDLEITFSYDRLDRVTTVKAEGRDRIKRYFDDKNDLIEIDQYLLNSGDAAIRLYITGEMENLRGNLAAEVSIGYDPGNDTATAPDKNRCIVDMYSYDEENRMKTRYKYIPGISWQKISYTYDLQDKIISRTVIARYRQEGKTYSTKFYYNYDNLGRLIYVTNDSYTDTTYAISYDSIGRVDEKRYFKENGSDIAEWVNYSYNIRDWLTEIDAGDNFSEEISYSGVYNGDIDNVWYKYGLQGGEKSYLLRYTYDGINRLTSVYHVEEEQTYSEAFRYDQVDRIIQKRKGKSYLGGFTPEYKYNGFSNKLSYITDIQQSNNYNYDARGNMTRDLSKKLETVKYDWRDRPVRFILQDSTGTWSATVDMVYDASGNRVIKKDSVTEDSVVTRAKAVVYVGKDMVFKNDDFRVEDYDLEYYNIDGEGRKEQAPNTNYYYLKNHLGSTHFVVNNEGNYIEATMYDAFGKMEQLAYSGDIGPVREKFTGKEFDEEGAVAGRTSGLGLFYFGSRYYDPVTGKWITPDKAQQFFDAYSYTGNRPVVYIDSDGDLAVIAVVAIGMAAGAAINAYIAHSKNKPVGKAALVGAAVGGASAFAAVAGGWTVSLGAKALGLAGQGGFIAAATGAGKAVVGGILGGGTGAFGHGLANTGSIGQGLSAVPGGMVSGGLLGLASFGVASATGFPGTVSDNAMEVTSILCGHAQNAAEAIINVTGGKSGGKGTGSGTGRGGKSNNGDPSSAPYGPTSSPVGEGEEGPSNIATPDVDSESEPGDPSIQSTEAEAKEVVVQVESESSESESESETSTTTTSNPAIVTVQTPEGEVTVQIITGKKTGDDGGEGD